MNKNRLTVLLSVMCVLLCALVLFCACTGGDNTTDTQGNDETAAVTGEATGENATDGETALDESTPETTPDTAAGPTQFTHTITVVDPDGNPVADVEVQMCAADGTCFLPVKTDANGQAHFEKEDGEYYVTIPSCPEGFVIDKEKKHTFEGDSNEMTITLEKVTAEEPTEEPTEAPTEPEKYPVWDADKAVVTNHSFDQLYKGDGSADDATNGGLNLFTPGQSGAWDKVADLTAGDVTTLTYWGWVGVVGELGQFGYQVDDGDPIYSADWSFSNPGEDLLPHCPAGTDNASRLKVTLDFSALVGEHSIRVLYKSADGAEVTLGLFTVKLPLPEVYYMSKDSADALQIMGTDLSFKEYVYTPGTYDEWENKVFTLKVGQTGGFWDLGFVALNTDVFEFGYDISGAGALPNFFPGAPYTAATTPDQLAAAQAMGYSNAGSFLCLCAEAALGVGENHVKVLVKLNNDPNQVYVLREYTVILEA